MKNKALCCILNPVVQEMCIDCYSEMAAKKVAEGLDAFLKKLKIPLPP